METTLKNTDAVVARSAADEAQIRRNLGMDGRTRWMRRVTTLLVLGGLGVGGYFLCQYLQRPDPPPAWQTVAVERGDLTTTVTATGSLAPVTTVDISAEISGRIVSVAVRENDRVTAGQVLV